MTTAPLTEHADPAPRHTLTLVFDPATFAELERAAGGEDVCSHLRSLSSRYARWNELREWLVQLETAYGPLPPEALERMHRQMLGLPRRAGGGSRSLTIALDPEEFAALDTMSGPRPLAPYAREVLVDHLTSTPEAAPNDHEPGPTPG